MPRYGCEREYRLGDYWLSKRRESPAWQRTWHDLESRQTRCVSLRTTDFEEAKQRLTDWFIANRQPDREDASETSLAWVFSRYYEHHAQHLTSWLQAQLALNKWLDFYGEATIKEAAVFSEQERFHRWLSTEKNLAHNTIHRTVAVGRGALNWAWKRGELESVPYFIPIALKQGQPIGRPLSVDEVAMVFDKATTTYLRTFILLMLGTAARPDAIFDLTFDRCDFESELIVLNPPGREQTKKHRPTVKMPRSLIPMLRHASQTRECIHVLSHKGEPLQSVRRRWRMARAAARMDDRVNPYSLRHTMARWLRKEGVSAWETAAQLGHKRKDVSTTEIYAPFSPDYLEASVSAIDVFFDRLRTICVPVDEMLKGR